MLQIVLLKGGNMDKEFIYSCLHASLKEEVINKFKQKGEKLYIYLDNRKPLVLEFIEQKRR